MLTLRRLTSVASCICLCLTLLSAAIVTTACSRSSSTHLPASMGLPYELVVIVPRAAYEGALADTIEAVLKASTPILPQHEPLFRLDIVKADAASKDGYPQGRHLTRWRTFRLRLLLTLDAHIAAPTMGIATNVVAKPQTEVRITARTPAELARYLGEVRERVVDIFVEAELEKEGAGLRQTHSRVTANSLHLLGHSICTPSNLTLSKAAKDFLWTGSSTGDHDQNFLYYTYAWDGRDLTAETFVYHHDSVLQANIPGSLPGQWMQTARYSDANLPTADRVPLVEARWRIINNNVRVHEVRGLWELHAGAMGGPFIAHERVDTAAGKVIVAEAFIFAPHSPKRNLLRQMEAALRTFE